VAAFVRILLLRRVLAGRTVADRIIETVPKRGYRFVGDVTVAGAERQSAGPSTVFRLRCPAVERIEPRKLGLMPMSAGFAQSFSLIRKEEGG